MLTWAGRAVAMDELRSSPNLFISGRLHNLGVSESGCIVFQESCGCIDLNETVQGYTAEQHTATVEQHNQPVFEHIQNLKSAMILLRWVLV